MAAGPFTSWEAQWVCTAPMQSETGSKAVRPSTLAHWFMPWATLTVTE